MPDPRFLTAVLGHVVIAPSGGARVTLASGGHLPPVVLRADGTTEVAACRGMLLGVEADARAVDCLFTLGVGDALVLYTDGITEARGGPFDDEEFGEQRLFEALAECAGMPAEAVVERVLMLADRWVKHGRHDDMAVLAIAAPTGQHLVAVGGHGRGRYTA